MNCDSNAIEIIDFEVDSIESKITEPTDLGNALLLAEFYKEKLRYSAGHNKWYWWNGTRWSQGSDEKATAAAIKIAQAIRHYSKKQDFKWARWADQSASYRGLTAMKDLAKTQLSVSVEEMDSHPMLLGCGNGTVDLTTGLWRPSSPQDLITRGTEVPYNADAQCPLFEKFVLEVMDGDQEMVAFLQRAIGYTLTGKNTEQVLFLLYGSGQNGKTVLTDVVGKLIGDLCTVVAPHILVKKKFADSGASPDLARLKGSRMAIASESEKDMKISEVTVKQLTGGDKVTARFLYGQPFEFTPEFKIWLSTNHLPHIENTDDGIWRRLLIIHFGVKFSEEKRDLNLPQKLEAELSGILNWAIKGVIKWQQQGLAIPEKVLNATTEHRDELDKFSGFINSRCLLNTRHKEGSKTLYEAYESWCHENGEVPESPTQFGRYLKERGFISTRSNQLRGWKGIKVKPIE